MAKNKKRVLKIVVSIVLLTMMHVVRIDSFWATFIGYGIIYLIIGSDVLKKAGHNLLRKDIFDENFLMSLATIGAFAIGQYAEGVAVMLFYQIGELFQSYAVNQSRKSISKMMDIRPDYANLYVEDKVEKVDPDEVEIGDYIEIKPGERVPLDGLVISGQALVDTSALTGESVPQKISQGQEILSGCINTNGVLKVEVKQEFEDSTVNKILDLVENASSKKAQTENFITKFARYYTPTVVACAFLLAVIPPVVIANAEFKEWIYRALTFLVISCPCALVISVPLSFFGGIGGASKLGILIKGSNYLEALAQTEVVVFDKTGTLTEGTFEVQKIHAVRDTEEKVLKYAAYVESFSTHPIALSLQKAFGEVVKKDEVKNLEEHPGQGLTAEVFGKNVFVGNQRLMQHQGVAGVLEPDVSGTIVHVAIDREYVGYLLIADAIKKDAQEALTKLKELHIEKTIMLTGDNNRIGQAVGKKLGLDQIYTELMPADKVACLEEILKRASSTGKVAFVGDGINDAPVLARADIGIAMGGLGSDAAIEAADVVIMTDEPSKIPVSIKLAKKTMGIVKQNILFALGIKVLFLVLGAVGMMTIGGAVFADVGVTVLAILNAMRCLYVKKLIN
ncbi:cadmium-translocating P-type ATPase [Vagococcus entomophilus]|uniref:Cd(2+)-exporting ATPase n=1 Tax=Vagococcus entomophilus TaxID=1160095 RepID=A0A430AJR8_9ENTE|nr:cadmium-translocating P-type ATPase [Vagococcus entomophilus]